MGASRRTGAYLVGSLAAGALSAGVGLTAVGTPAHADHLSRASGSDGTRTSLRTVRLDAHARDRVADRGPALRTGPMSTGRFTMAALTWRGTATTVRLRTHSAEGWSAWRTLTPLADGPDADPGTSADPDAVPRLHATDVLWVGPADGAWVQVGSGRPRQVSLRLIDTATRPPSPAPADGRRATHHRGTHRLRPHLHSRRAWGADPRLRDGSPRYDRTIQQVHVHHTVSGNGYGRSAVPGILQGIYRYHTRVLGWSDIGYNFLVDRFGRIWVGRAGGAARPVLGAHTLGFNSTSTGVAVIGDESTHRPSGKVIGAIARLAAWKLHRYHRSPTGRVAVYSHGSGVYAAGRTVRLHTIDGHRDTFATECPGKHLYADLPRIRHRAKHILRAWRLRRERQDRPGSGSHR